MHVMMRVDVRRECAGQVAEDIELTFELPLLRPEVARVERARARGEVHVQADAQPRMLASHPRRGARARHVDHEARAGHDPSLVSLDDAPGGPVVGAEVVGVDDQIAAGAARARASGRPGVVAVAWAS